MSDFLPIRKAAEIAGGVRALARELNVSPSIVTEWAKKTNPVPIKRCVQLERFTKGEVTRKELRPDDWHEIWPDLLPKGNK